MSVNYTTITGYGFQISEEGVRELIERLEYIDDYLGDELDPLLEVVVAGSYMSGDIEYAISVKRLTKRYGYEDGFEGFVGFKDKPVTGAEENALHEARVKYQSEFQSVGSFSGGLWS